MTTRTVHMLALFHAGDGTHERGRFKRFQVEVPTGVNPLEHFSLDEHDEMGKKSEWGHPLYAGFVVEHDPEAPQHSYTRLTDMLVPKEAA